MLDPTTVKPSKDEGKDGSGDVMLDPLDFKEIKIAEQIIEDFYPLKNYPLERVFPKLCACCKYRRPKSDKFRKQGTYKEILNEDADLEQQKDREQRMSQYIDDNLNKIIEGQKGF